MSRSCAGTRQDRSFELGCPPSLRGIAGALAPAMGGVQCQPPSTRSLRSLASVPPLRRGQQMLRPEGRYISKPATDSNAEPLSPRRLASDRNKSPAAATAAIVITMRTVARALSDGGGASRAPE